MYYRNRNNLSADIGAMLNNENVAATLAQDDVVRTAESLPVGGIPPMGQRCGCGPEKGKIDDFGLMQAMYTETAKKLLPYVKKAVNNNMYTGSPGLRPIGPDRSFTDKVTDEVMTAVCRDNDEAQEICLDNHRQPWNNKQLLYDLIYTMVLTEIFLVSRER